MYNLARYLLGDDDESRDVVSDVFTQLLESSTVLIPGTERAYLMQSVRHHCFNLIAHKSVRQQIFRLRYLQGQSYQEVAQATGVSKVTVYHHLSQAIEWIKSKTLK